MLFEHRSLEFLVGTQCMGDWGCAAMYILIAETWPIVWINVGRLNKKRKHALEVAAAGGQSKVIIFTVLLTKYDVRRMRFCSHLYRLRLRCESTYHSWRLGISLARLQRWYQLIRPDLVLDDFHRTFINQLLHNSLRELQPLSKSLRETAD
jgi:hypothetical protein